VTLVATHSPMSILCAMSLRLSGLPCTWRMLTALDTREQSASRCKYVNRNIEIWEQNDIFQVFLIMQWRVIFIIHSTGVL